MSKASIETTWNLESVYPTTQDWKKDFDTLDAKVKAVLEMQGKVTASAENLFSTFEASTKLERTIEKLWSYAHHRADEDLRNSENMTRSGMLEAKSAEISAALSWLDPEILAAKPEVLKSYLDQPILKDYEKRLLDLIRYQPHIRTAGEEQILGLLSDTMQGSYKAFSMFENADMKFEDVVDSKGLKHPLKISSAIQYYESSDRELRKSTFENYNGEFLKYKNTLAATLESNVKRNVSLAKIRKFNSALEASLFSDQVPVSVYNGLIQVVREHVPLITRWIKIKKKKLGVSEFCHYDQFVPLSDDGALEIPYAQAMEWVLEAAKPMGEEYVEAMKLSTKERWTHVYPQDGKRSGAYSGGCYDTYPFLLLNYKDRIGDVFTLAHELGHSLHSYFSRKNQPYSKSNYPIFTAEVASTTMEMLLYFYLEKKLSKPSDRIMLLDKLFINFRSTLFRQTMFAEFERDIHAHVEKGQPLTADWLCQEFSELNKAYFGPEMKHDDLIGAEWARIPHFYYNFYVYKYATSFAAAQYFARKIYEGDRAGTEAYIGFLKSGGSMDPIPTLKKAGLDLSDQKPLVLSMKVFEDALSEAEKLI